MTLAEEISLMDRSHLESYALVISGVVDRHDRFFGILPECPVHGPRCLPYAEKWIKKKLQESGASVISKTNVGLLMSASAAIDQVVNSLGDDVNKFLSSAQELIRRCIDKREAGYLFLFGSLMVAKSHIDKALECLKEEAKSSELQITFGDPTIILPLGVTDQKQIYHDHAV